MTLEIWLLFAAVLFAFGIYAVVARRNLIAVLIGVELMLNGSPGTRADKVGLTPIARCRALR